MKLRQLAPDTGGATLVEFTVMLPLFLTLTFGTVFVGLLMWVQIGLQHGVELAARCASASGAATAQDVTTPCSTTSGIQNFAAQNAYGLSPPSSAFTVTTPACGNQVSASYSFNYLTDYFFGVPSVTLTASSCYPKGT